VLHSFATFLCGSGLYALTTHHFRSIGSTLNDTPCPTGVYPASVITYAELNHYGWIAYLWADHDNGGAYGMLASMQTHEPNLQGQPVEAALLHARGWVKPGGP